MIFLISAVLGIGAFFVMSEKSVAQNLDKISPTWSTFDELFKKYGSIYGVNWQILKAIAMNESDLGRDRTVLEGLNNPKNIEGSKSYDGLSWGLMQVTLNTGREYDASITPEKLNNAEYSIKIASQYLAWVQRQFALVDPRYTEWVIKSYNQGVGNTNKERQGLVPKGYAQEYWERFERNLTKVKGG